MAAKRAQGRRGAPGEITSRSAVAPVVDLNRRGGGSSNSEGSYR